MKIHSPRLFDTVCISAALLFSPGLVWGAVDAQASSAPIVGEVTTVIGQATISHGSGEASKIRRGQPVHAGDRLETQDGGHVHVRFIDGGMVSVRPLSRLNIENYSRGDRTTPGAVRFNLERGVVRSVTGTWGEENRDRFRLNTPVVAIGIKGTDFVVQAWAGKTQAHVVSGAITMVPLTACLGGSAVCDGSQTPVLLSADMHGKMLEYGSGSYFGHSAQSPRLISMLTQTPASENADTMPLIAQAENKRQLADDVEERLVNVIAINSKTAGVGASAGNQTPNDADVNKGATAVADRKMVWKRIALPLGWMSTDTFAVSQVESGMTATASNFFYTLYRDQTTNPAYLGGSGKVSLKLAEGAAVYGRPGLYNQPVTISNPVLDLDFQAKNFATRLDLAGDFGATRFESSGAIGATGLLAQQDGTQRLSGALSHDARQAGYLFNKTVGIGQVSGLTLWQR